MNIQYRFTLRKSDKPLSIIAVTVSLTGKSPLIQVESESPMDTSKTLDNPEEPISSSSNYKDNDELLDTEEDTLSRIFSPETLAMLEEKGFIKRKEEE